ncbi:MAG TPA: aspartyl protease family protein [Kofleriaceae bacterium]|jgi:hypothetical protein
MLNRWSSLAIALALGACSVGAPPGFSPGTQWTFPLVDPLDNGRLVTAVTIEGKGPYLFVIDPEATTSIIDERVVIDAGLLIDRGYATRLRGDDGVLRPRFNAQLLDVRIGNLAVEMRRALVVPHETLAGLGRDIRGVLGRKFIEDSLVFGFDRDRGIAWLQTVGAFRPNPGATRIGFDLVRAADDNRFGADGVDHTRSDNRTPEVTTSATVDGKRLRLDVTFGAVASALRPDLVKAIGAADPDAATTEVDASGALHRVPLSPTPVSIALGPVTNDHALLGEYVNRDEMVSSARFVDGTLGLDFFAPYSVAADWDARAIYLTPRGDTAAQRATRLARWPDIARCANPGCVTLTTVAAATTPPPAAPGFAPTTTPPPSETTTPQTLHVTREPGAAMPLELRLRASGHRDLVVSMPPGVNDVAIANDGARYDVIDADPFPRPCDDPAQACVR